MAMRLFGARNPRPSWRISTWLTVPARAAGLSALEADMHRNLQLLKERSWFDIPMVYATNRRAILAMEKGTPGERAFNEAFAAWGQ